MTGGVVEVIGKVGCAAEAVEGGVVVVEADGVGFAWELEGAGVKDGAAEAVPVAGSVGVAEDDEAGVGDVIGGESGGEVRDGFPVVDHTGDSGGLGDEFE